MRRSLLGVSVLHVITRLDKGGSAEVVLDLARLLREDGARVGIVYGKTADPMLDLMEYHAQTGVEFFFAATMIREIALLSDLRAFLKLRFVMKKWRPDIVHTHTSKAGIVGRLAAWSTGIRCIVHTPHGHIFYGYFSPMKTKIFIMLEKLSALVTGRLVTLTRRGMDEHLLEGVGRPEQFRIIPSGANVERFFAGRGERVRAEIGCGVKTLIGWAGRLTEVKDGATFLRASKMILAGHPDTRFILAGEGEDRGQLETLARELDIEAAVHFLGNRDDMPDVMAAMDVFVLSSINEGFGRVIVEAMASGVPVVATAVGGVPEVVEDGVSGLLVPPRDPERLAEAVGELMKNKELRRSLRENGRRRARAYDTRVMVDSYEELYVELLQRR